MIERHAFERGRQVVLDAVGRVMHLCAVCGKNGRGKGHRLNPDLVRTTRTRPSTAPPPPSRAIRLLAIAVEEVLLEPDGVGWRLRFRLADIAATIRETYPDLMVETPTPTVAETPPEPAPVAVAAPVHHVPSMTPKGVRRFIRTMKDAGLARVATAALDAGWSGRPSGNGHLIMRSPDGVHSMSFTRSDTDPRSWRNSRAAARRAGLTIA